MYLKAVLFFLLGRGDDTTGTGKASVAFGLGPGRSVNY